MESLGRYKLLETLGEGGMAEVFRARLDGPMGFQKDLAIKRIRDSVVRSNEEHARSLINEARIGGRLKHPNVVEVYELGQEDGAYYIAMELVDGASLREILGTKTSEKRTVPHNVLLDIAIQVCRGLAYAHDFTGEDGEDLAVVHRDVKPSNIMVTRAGGVKIMDFGIAKSDSNLFDTTATGIAKGTPLYMSPEQLRGMRPLPRTSDLFSLGAILFEMITGELLFAGQTIPEIINRVLYQPLSPDIQLAEETIPGTGPILERLLERDVAHREQDAANIAIELQHVLEWQNRDISTASFVRQFIKRRDQPDDASSLELEVVERESDQPTAKINRGAEAFVSHYVLTVRRRRLRFAATMLLFLGLAAGSAAYVWRGTLGASIGTDAGTEAMNSGDLRAAEAAWSDALRANPGRVEARFGQVALASLQPLEGENDVEKITDLLELAPTDTMEDDMRRLRALAGVYQAAGDYRQASLYLEAAVGRARQADRIQSTGVPPALLWEAAELTLLLDAAKEETGEQARNERTHPNFAEEFSEQARNQRARSYFAELATGQPPGAVADAASAHLAALEGNGEGLLRAELLWRIGDLEAAWATAPRLLKKRGLSQDQRQRERLVWVYRALGEGRYDDAGDVLETLGLLTGERERRRQALVAQAAVLAAQGRTQDSRTKLDAALKLSSQPELEATARLQVVLALLRTGKAPKRASALLEEVAVQVGDTNPDLQLVLQLQRGERESLEPAGQTRGFRRLSYDPRSGRLFPTGLSRGSPSGARLAGPDSYPERNRTAEGNSWPYGPAFHPLDGGALPVLFNPAR